MVQWLRICPTMQSTTVWSLSRKIPHDTKQLSQWATSTEPLLWSPRAATTEAQVPRRPCTTKREAITMRSPLAAAREKHRAAMKTQHSQEKTTMTSVGNTPALGKASCPTVNSSMEGSTQWETEQLVKNWGLTILMWVSFEEDHPFPAKHRPRSFPAAWLQPRKRSWVRVTQLSCNQIPDPQKLWNNKCLFVILSCYTSG